MSIDRWLLIAVGVLLPLWIITRIILLPAMLGSPAHGRMLATYVRLLAEQRKKPRRR